MVTALATYTTSSLTVGTHTITAVYDGDANFIGSTSAPLSQVVNDRSIVTSFVTSFTATSTGFTAVFNRALNLGNAFTPILNLYDNSTGTLGSSDVTLIGTQIDPNTHQPAQIRGSLVIDQNNTRITFIQTGQTGRTSVADAARHATVRRAAERHIYRDAPQCHERVPGY